MPPTTPNEPSQSGRSDDDGLSFVLPRRLFGGEGSSSSSPMVLKCVDCHAAGEPARVVLSGVPPLPDSCVTALLKRRHMMTELDSLRRVLLLEPRGYPCQNADFVFPADPRSGSPNLQYVIAEQWGIYPLMSGHNTVCVATALLECGVVPMSEPVSRFTLESPAGPIDISAKCRGGKAESIAFRNAPSFVERLDATVDVPHGIGPVRLDIAYGGMWYAIVDLGQFESSPALRHLDVRMDPSNASELCRVGEMIKAACREQFPVDHPLEDYPGVDILAFRGPPSEGSGATSRNAVVMSNGTLDWDRPETWTAMLDRSPCGTGTCAIMAAMHARGELGLGEPFVHESIVGTKFTGTILEETTVAGKKAIVPQIEGSAYITQYSEVVVDECDPFPDGYKVADIW